MEFARTIYLTVLTVSVCLIGWGIFYTIASERFSADIKKRIHDLESKLERGRNDKGPSSYDRHKTAASFLRAEDTNRRQHALMAVYLGVVPILAGTLLLICLVFAVASLEGRPRSVSGPERVSDASKPAPVAFRDASAAAGPNGVYLLAYTAGIMRQREIDKKPQLTAGELALLLKPLADVGIASAENVSTFSREFLLELGKKGINVTGDLIFEGLKSLIPVKAKSEDQSANVPVCNVTVNIPADVASPAPAKPNKAASPRSPKKPKEASSCQAIQPPPGRLNITPPLS